MSQEMVMPPRHGFRLDAEGDGCANYLKQTNGRAEKYAYDVRDLRRIASNLEKELDGAGIAQSNRTGVTAVVRSAGPDRSRKTARWTPQAIGTVVYLRRYDGGWRLMMADRVTVYAGQAEKHKIAIDRSEYAAIQERAVSNFEVAP
ncbi:hypothetical protein [Ciceribacter selenitireducens]|uniref:hypothetical protein n=1 Tax=Ciceribacter selenitireducens TaxID=448181 RepID=UPI000DE4C926|nr:hypothetical protein [Ciceribacter selenitireducens]